jgi:hypothetical protein
MLEIAVMLHVHIIKGRLKVLHKKFTVSDVR